MKKTIPTMSNQELLDSYKKGYKWISDHMQVTETNKNELGEEITPRMFKEWEVGLKRLENIELEMQKRGIVYG